MLIEDVPGHRQDHARQVRRAHPRLHVSTHPVHARPAAQRRHRRVVLQPARRRSSSSARARSSRRSSWPTRSTAPRRAPSRRCWNAWTSARSASKARRGRCRGRSWCWRPRTRSSSKGTFPLPEAQLDRFLLRLSIGYPTRVRREGHRASLPGGQPAGRAAARSCDQSELLAMQRLAREVHVAEAVEDYIVRLVRASRLHASIELGASPRATLALYHAAQALAGDQWPRLCAAGRRQAPGAGGAHASADHQRAVAPARQGRRPTCCTDARVGARAGRRCRCHAAAPGVQSTRSHARRGSGSTLIGGVLVGQPAAARGAAVYGRR